MRETTSFKEVRMDKSTPKSYLGMIVVLGSLWGLAEAGLGMGLRSCAAYVSGALMAGAAMFFVAAGWAVSRKVLGIVLMVFMAAGFKLFDALLLSYPLTHGAIGNPIFAFFMEALAFLILIAVMKAALMRRPAGQALLGGMAALLAANLFPLVRFATGVPACVVAGTGYPLSLYYIHIAVAVTMITVPLGFWVGERLAAWDFRAAEAHHRKMVQAVLSPSALVLCLAILALLRLT
jgi:hypothetical protein